MNALESYPIENPWGVTEECAKFVIDDTTKQFLLSNIATVGRQYTLTFWIKAEAKGSLVTAQENIAVTTQWTKHIITFTATQSAVTFLFETIGTYYIFHAQLEVGNKSTDWTPAPEDVDSDINDAQTTADDAKQKAGEADERITTAESLIQQLSNSIAALVRDGDGGTLLKQDSNGLWYFDISGIQDTLDNATGGLDELDGLVRDANGKIDVLQSTAKALQDRTEYVRSYTDENDQPCLELGEGDSVYKVRITNTDIRFMEGSNIPTTVNKDGLETQNIKVNGEIVQGGYVMMNTSDGGWGLLWKGVSS